MTLRRSWSLRVMPLDTEWVWITFIAIVNMLTENSPLCNTESQYLKLARGAADNKKRTSITSLVADEMPAILDTVQKPHP